MDTPKVYISVDGDDVGRRLEYFILLNQLEELREFSHIYEQRMQWLLDNIITQLDANIIFAAADSVLAYCYSRQDIFEKLQEIHAHFFTDQVGITISVGVGSTPREAYLALKLAKLSGKNSVKRFEDLLKC